MTNPYAGRRTSLTDALNHVTTFAYDKSGNRISVTDANQHTKPGAPPFAVLAKGPRTSKARRA